MPGSGSPATGELVGIILGCLLLFLGCIAYEIVAEYLHWWAPL